MKLGEDSPYRYLVLAVETLLESSQFASQLASWLPAILRNDEFRYLNIDLDAPMVSLNEDSWFRRALGYSLWSLQNANETQDFEDPAPGSSLPLTNANFVTMLSSTFEDVKSIAFE